MKAGARSPTIIIICYFVGFSGAVSLNKEKVGFMADIWENCQALTSNPVKVALPGPMTITNTSIRRYHSCFLLSLTSAMLSS